MAQGEKSADTCLRHHAEDGILLAVMERGAGRFFAGLSDLTRWPGRPAQHLARMVSAAVRTLQRHPEFLRLLIVFAAQPPAVGQGEIQAVVCRVASTCSTCCGRSGSAALTRAIALDNHPIISDKLLQD